MQKIANVDSIMSSDLLQNYNSTLESSLLQQLLVYNDAMRRKDCDSLRKGDLIVYSILKSMTYFVLTVFLE